MLTLKRLINHMLLLLLSFLDYNQINYHFSFLFTKGIILSYLVSPPY